MSSVQQPGNCARCGSEGELRNWYGTPLCPACCRAEWANLSAETIEHAALTAHPAYAQFMRREAAKLRAIAAGPEAAEGSSSEPETTIPSIPVRRRRGRPTRLRKYPNFPEDYAAARQSVMSDGGDLTQAAIVAELRARGYESIGSPRTLKDYRDAFGLSST